MLLSIRNSLQRISDKSNYWEVHINSRLYINTVSIVILGNSMMLR